jgi:hypothetical protein
MVKLRNGCPKIKDTTAFQIEAGVVPMTGQDAILDAAPLEREAHVRIALASRIINRSVYRGLDHRNGS